MVVFLKESFICPSTLIFARLLIRPTALKPQNLSTSFGTAFLNKLFQLPPVAIRIPGKADFAAGIDHAKPGQATVVGQAAQQHAHPAGSAWQASHGRHCAVAAQAPGGDLFDNLVDLLLFSH